jgi:hypothetical protein
MFMRKTSRRDHPDEPGNSGTKACRRGGSKGRWEFTSSGRLFSMGGTDAVRRAAYRAADGEMRLLAL